MSERRHRHDWRCLGCGRFIHPGSVCCRDCYWREHDRQRERMQRDLALDRLLARLDAAERASGAADA